MHRNNPNCETKSGRKTILFESHDVAGKYKKMLTPRAKRSIDQILCAVEQKKSSIQQPTAVNATSPPPMVVEVTDVVGEDDKPCIGATGQVKMGADTPTEQDAAGQGMGDEDECMKSCGPDPPDCVLLHDKLSLMWGEYKDKVDELWR